MSVSCQSGGACRNSSGTVGCTLTSTPPKGASGWAFLHPRGERKVRDEGIDAGQPGCCPGALAGGLPGGLQLPRHPQHRDHRVRQRLPGGLHRVGPQREGGLRGGYGGLHRGGQGPLRHEARGAERGGGPAVHHRLHRGGGRHGGRRGRRPRHALLPERAGQPPLRRGRQTPHAGARRQPGVRQLHRRGVPPLGGIRHPGAAAALHPGAIPRAWWNWRSARSPR